MKKISGTLPRSKSCLVCGDENRRGLGLCSRIQEGVVHIDYTTDLSDVGYRHIVHGGLSMTLLDEVMTWAAIVEMGSICVAAEMTTRFRAALEAGVDIRVEGWVAKSSRRVCYTNGRIVDGGGKELLTAEAKYMPMPSDGIQRCEDDFVYGPDTIDPRLIFDRS